MKINGVSRFNNRQYIIFKNSEQENTAPSNSLMSESDYFKKRIEIENQKNDMLKRTAIGIACLLTSIVGGIFMIVRDMPRGKNLKKAQNNAKKVLEEAAPEFRNLSLDEYVPTIKTCKSLDAGLKDFLEHQMLLYDSESDIVKLTGAKPTNRIILNGAPGVGKSFFAKIFAKSIGAEYLEVKIPDIISQWAGEGVQNMDRIFKSISKHAGANPEKKFVVTMNEIDSYIQPVEQYAYNGRGHGTHWITKMEERGAFLDALEELQRACPNVTIIGTTNLPPKHLDGAAKSRFNTFNVKFPNKDALNEALKARISLLSYGEAFIKTNQSNLQNLAKNMEAKKYSFRDLEKIVNNSTNYYLADAAKDSKAKYKFDYLKKAFDKFEFTDGEGL